MSPARMPVRSSPVQGYCPFGCGQTLRLIEGAVCCASSGCPHPSAIGEILADPEHEHIVDVDGKRFSVQHPLRERVNGDLFGCRLHGILSACGGPPVYPGRYRASPDSGPATVPGWRFERLDDDD